MGKKLDQSGKWKDAAKGELRGVFSVKKDKDGRDVIKMGEPVYTLQGYSVPKDYVSARNESIAIRDGTKK
ncbi:MAG: hypothetical protein JXR23_10365 [Pontiellaceae bacterium]|nr:hypothetical protein [Pontiellaceae bacterium]